jgi:hypothetical protein
MCASGRQENVSEKASMSSEARRKGRLAYLARRRLRLRHRTLARQTLTLLGLAVMLALALWLQA